MDPVHAEEPSLTSDSAAEEWRGAWSAALEAVEMDVQAAEELISRLHQDAQDEELPVAAAQDWIAPSLLGPVPLEFADRARRLLRRQLEVSERLAEAMVQLRSHRRALGKMDRAERPPVYYDRAL